MSITTNFINYSVSHDKNGGSGGTTVMRGGVNNSDLPSDLNVTSITAAQGNINMLQGTSLSYNDGSFVYLDAGNGKIVKIKGSELNYGKGKIDDFEADKIKAGKIEADEISATKGWLETLNSKYITTEYLTVTKQAHFFELIIDKVRSVGGTLIMTPAQCVIDYAKAYDSNNIQVILDTNTVKEEIKTAHPTWTDEQINDEVNDIIEAREATVAYYDVFWLAQDAETGRENDNDWVVGDQAFCQSFNVHAGTSYNVSNKYYWRLVKSILADRYMNLNTGAELSLAQAGQASVNSVNISTPRVTYKDPSDNEVVVNMGWNTTAQTSTEYTTGVSWSEISGGAGSITEGTMTTTNTTFGISLKPIDGTTLYSAIPEKFIVDCTSARLNIGIYYMDDSSEWFPAISTPATTYTLTLHANMPIKEVIIANADEVEWKLVHGIRISNDYANGECDEMLVGSASIPSVGDNIAQLGYRYNDPNSGAGDDKPRASAIIISAYQTPDKGTGQPGQQGYKRGLTPPSYAQYKLINDFNLSRHRHTFFDAVGSAFYGDFYVGTGNDTDDYSEIGQQVQDLFVAYANDNGHGQPDSTPYDPTTYPGGWVKTHPIGGQSYEFMGFCTAAIPAGETRATVEATLTFNNYEWSMVPGGTGTPGGDWYYAYKNTDSATTAPNLPSSSADPRNWPSQGVDGWFLTPTQPSTGYYTWMTQRFISGDGNLQAWHAALRLTGADGHEGTDGDEIEFIYTRNNSGENPTAPVYEYDASAPGYQGTPVNQIDDWYGKDSNGVTWTDNPQGVGDPGVQGNFKYEYVVQRFKRNGNWSAYQPNLAGIWSNWGEKGQDGDGYEYIYCQVGPQGPQGYQGPQAPPTPVAPGPGDEQYPAPWTDDPTGVSSDWPQEYVSMRKKQNGSWGLYSSPALWAQYVPQGVQGRAGINGPFTEWAYKNAVTISQSDMPANGYPISDIAHMNGWTETSSTPPTGQFTWYITRYNTYNESNVLSYGNWNQAVRLTGEKGEDGADGTDFEFIYTRNNGIAGPQGVRGPQAPQAPVYDSNNDPVNTQDDWKGTDNNGVSWTDNPQGVQANLQFEYMVQRKKLSGHQAWEPYGPQTAAVWSKWGENGRDGDGYEYIYVLTGPQCPAGYQGPGAPSTPSSDPYQDEYYSAPWTDDPTGVTEGKNKEWVSTRKKQNGAWGSYSPPALWAQWVPAGTQGANGGRYIMMYKNVEYVAPGPTPVTLTSIEWESTTATSVQGNSPNWPRIRRRYSDSTTSYIYVSTSGVTTSTIITSSTAAGTYSNITASYQDKTTTNSLTYTVTVPVTLTSIEWESTTATSVQGNSPNWPRIRRRYSNNTTSYIYVSTSGVTTSTSITSSTAAGTYSNITASYQDKTTTNSLTYTVTAAQQNNYFLGATTKESFTLSDLNQYVASRPSSITVPATFNGEFTAWIYPQSWGRPTSAISSLSHDNEIASFNYGELGVPLGYDGMWVNVGTECTYTLTWPS